MQLRLGFAEQAAQEGLSWEDIAETTRAEIVERLAGLIVKAVAPRERKEEGSDD